MENGRARTKARASHSKINVVKMMVNHHHLTMFQWLSLAFFLALPFTTILGGGVFRDFFPLFGRQCHELGVLVVAEFDSIGANSAA